MFLVGLKSQGVATDNEIKQLTLQMKGNEAELYPEMIKARLALLKAQKARALRPPSSGGGGYKLTPQDRVDLNIISSNIKDAEDNMATAAEEASMAEAAYNRYSKDATLTPQARKSFMDKAKVDQNAAVDKYDKFKAAKEVNMSAANSYGASGGTTKTTRTTAPGISTAPRKIK
jgi:DNA invertase Pin-like site-specific DNA recombinase